MIDKFAVHTPTKEESLIPIEKWLMEELKNFLPQMSEAVYPIMENIIARYGYDPKKQILLPLDINKVSAELINELMKDSGIRLELRDNCNKIDLCKEILSKYGLRPRKYNTSEVLDYVHNHMPSLERAKHETIMFFLNYVWLRDEREPLPTHTAYWKP